MPFSGSSDEYTGKLVNNPKFPKNRRKLRHKAQKEQQALNSDGSVVENIVSKGGSKKVQDVKAKGVSIIVEDIKKIPKDASKMAGVEDTPQLAKFKDNKSEAKSSPAPKKKKTSKWMEHVSAYRKQNPKVNFKNALKNAKKTYKK